MSDSPPDSLIPYDDIVQEALRAVVGRVLGEQRAAEPADAGLEGGAVGTSGHVGGDPRHLLAVGGRPGTVIPGTVIR